MTFFLDTSALVKLYVREAGTDAMLRLEAGAGSGEFVLSALAAVELASALTIKHRAGLLAASAHAVLFERFEEHLRWRYVQQPITAAVIQRASNLVRSHALRAYDGVQLACALSARPEQPYAFISSDLQLLSAARAEGLDCFDPVHSA